jgi:hypothetical protein
MELVEKNEADLVGLGDHVRSRVQQAHSSQRRITDDDLLAHIRDYLEASAHGYSLRMEPAHPLRGALKLDAKTAARLQDFRAQYGLTRSRLESNHETPIVVRNHVSAGDTPPKYELINQYHPLIRMIAKDQENIEEASIPHAVQISASRHGLSIAPGVYVFAAESWVFRGVREEHKLGALFVPLEGGAAIAGEMAFDLLNALRMHATDWINAGLRLASREDAVELHDKAQRLLAGQFRQVKAQHDAENADRVRIQKETIERNAARRRESLQERLRRAQDSGQKTVIQLTKGQLRKQEEQRQVAIEKLQSRERLYAERPPLVDGFVEVLP